jgi:hypothetical protein
LESLLCIDVFLAEGCCGGCACGTILLFGGLTPLDIVALLFNFDA